MSRQPKHIFEFGPYRLDATERLLLRNGENIPLQPKAFDLLLILVQNHGHLMEKDELLKSIWPDTVVEEVNLANNVSVLRKALGEGGNEQRFIETVPRRGYRFVAPARQPEEMTAESQVIEGNELPLMVVEQGELVAAAMKQQATPPSEPSGWSLDEIEWIKRRPGLSRLPRLKASLIILALFGSIVAVGLWLLKRQPARPGAAVKSIAVLPFKPLVAENRDEAMEMGMADTLITKLSGLRQLIVRPTSAVRRYTALDQDPLAAGREQRVEAVLEASYHWTGEKIRVTVRLLQVSNGAPLWAYQCDTYCADIFTAQDIISEKVAQSLMLGLTGVERERLAKHYTENKEAYLLYQKGRFYYSKRNAEAIKKCIDYLNQAVEKDPAYALAYAGLADAYGASPTYGAGSPQDSYPKAKAAAKRALELDETLAEAHASLGNVLFQFDWNLPESNRELQRAIELNPNYAFAHQSYGRRNLLVMRRFDEAITHLKRAQELDPLSLIINSDIGTFYFFAGEYDKAIEHQLKTLEMDQSFYTAHRYLGRAYR